MTRVTCRSLVYSPLAEECGKQCGKVQNIFLKVVGGRGGGGGDGGCGGVSGGDGGGGGGEGGGGGGRSGCCC